MTPKIPSAPGIAWTWNRPGVCKQCGKEGLVNRGGRCDPCSCTPAPWLRKRKAAQKRENGGVLPQRGGVA